MNASTPDSIRAVDLPRRVRLRSAPRMAKWRDRHSEYRAKNVRYQSQRNGKSRADATMNKQPWDLVDDEKVASGLYTQKQLSTMLGRSLKAIERRRHYLRQANIPGQPRRAVDVATGED